MNFRHSRSQLKTGCSMQLGRTDHWGIQLFFRSSSFL